MPGELIPVLVDDPLQMAWLDRNDLGNAERMVRLSKGLLLWIDGIGWVAYDGRRWSARDGDRMARRLAHDVARHIDREAAALNEIANDQAALKAAFGWDVPTDLAEERVIALRKHAVASGDASRTNAMLTQAKELTQLRADRDEFDQDPLAINLANGTLRFVAGAGGGWEPRLDPHEPTDRFMQMANVAYDPDVQCPDWMERMKLVQPDRDQRGLLQQIYGYCLTGLTSEQKFFIYQGRGGDGKSATNMVVSEMFGDYARHADVKTFLKGATKSGSDHSSDLARLSGDVRFVLCEEPDRNATWDGGLLKKITGGKVTARPLREAEIEYYPHWKLIVEVNPLPAVPSDDDGFWRRCWVVPWPFQFKLAGSVQPEAMDVVVARLLEQSSGILNWMVAGACRWLETRRLPMAAAAKEAIDGYRQSASPMGEWLGDRCDLSDRNALTRAGTLYTDFKEWCEKAGIEKVPTQTAFGRALRDRQIMEKKDGAGNRFRRGIALKPDGIGGDLGAIASAAATPDPFDRGGGGREAARSAGGFDGFDEDMPA